MVSESKSVLEARVANQYPISWNEDITKVQIKKETFLDVPSLLKFALLNALFSPIYFEALIEVSTLSKILES